MRLIGRRRRLLVSPTLKCGRPASADRTFTTIEPGNGFRGDHAPRAMSSAAVSRRLAQMSETSRPVIWWWPTCASGVAGALRAARECPIFASSLGFVGEVCDGGFAEEVQLPARLLVRHDPALSPRIAVLAEPLAVAIYAVRRLDARTGEPVLVVGCGTIGGLAALVLSRSHDGPIMVSDLNAGRANAVAQRAQVTVAALDAAAISAALQGQRLRYAIDATGSSQAITDTLGLTLRRRRPCFGRHQPCED